MTSNLVNEPVVSPKEKVETTKKLSLSKRKRKTERDLQVLRMELKKDLMWSREKI